MTIGIVGLGNFGQFAARTLAQDTDLEVVAYDPGDSVAPAGVKKLGLEKVAAADVIVLCIPLSAYEAVLGALKSLIEPDTLVVDICSVKTEAAQRLRAALPGHQNLLITHPMFGPQSAADGTTGHTLVVTDALGQKAQDAVAYCESKLGLRITRMTDEQHDRAMADVHALTFFIARGLAGMDLKPSLFQAPSFQLLLDLVAFDQAHSEALFRTIELGNPFARESRIKLITQLEILNDQLDREQL